MKTSSTSKLFLACALLAGAVTQQTRAEFNLSALSDPKVLASGAALWIAATRVVQLPFVPTNFLGKAKDAVVHYGPATLAVLAALFAGDSIKPFAPLAGAVAFGLAAEPAVKHVLAGPHTPAVVGSGVGATVLTAGAVVANAVIDLAATAPAKRG